MTQESKPPYSYSTGPLMQNPYFRGWMIGLIVFNCVVWISESIYLVVNGWAHCSTPECVSNFSDLMKIPLTVFTLSLGILGLIAAIVRSSQTAKQIELSEQQMVARNYFDHKKDFIEQINKNIEQKGVEIHGVGELYRRCFPGNSIRQFAILESSERLPAFLYKYALILIAVVDLLKTSDAKEFSKTNDEWASTYNVLVDKICDLAFLMGLVHRKADCQAEVGEAQALLYGRLLVDTAKVCSVLLEYLQIVDSDIHPYLILLMDNDETMGAKLALIEYRKRIP